MSNLHGISVWNGWIIPSWLKILKPFRLFVPPQCSVTRIVRDYLHEQFRYFNGPLSCSDIPIHVFVWMSSIRKNIHICEDFLIFNGNTCSSTNPVFPLQNILYHARIVFSFMMKNCRLRCQAEKKKTNMWSWIMIWENDSHVYRNFVWLMVLNQVKSIVRQLIFHSFQDVSSLVETLSRFTNTSTHNQVRDPYRVSTYLP